MGVLENITQMRSQGMSDEEVVQKLQEQGTSPREINDALNQAQIKNAVGNQEGSSDVPAPSGQNYAEQPQNQYNEQQYPQTQETGEAYPPQQGYEDYYRQDYGGGYDYGYGGYQQGYGTDTSTMVEVAEQVFSEKMQKTQKQVKDLAEFKTLTESKVEQLSERIKRIENLMDKMQAAILDKIGSYGKNLDNVRKEMDMMQDSFAKVVPEMAEKASSKKRKHPAKKSKKTSKKSSKKKASKKKK